MPAFLKDNDIQLKDITFCCQDCGTVISKKSALYGLGRCKSCSRKGIIFSKARCLKISKSKQGKKRSNETCLKISETLKGKYKGEKHPMFGKHHSKKVRQKISKSRIGKGCGKNNHNFGKKFSKETRLKLSKSLKGRISPMRGKKLSKEHCLKISKAHKGKIVSLESRLKMSKAQKGKKRGNKNPSWQGGISFLPYTPKFNKDLKLKIRQRDNYTCQRCGLEEENHYRGNNQINLTIHHINYNKENCKETNLITLCNKCNSYANTNRDYWFAYYTYIMKTQAKGENNDNSVVN